MGLLKKAGDLVYTFRFLALLTTPFEKTKAYEMGLIDEKGKKLKKPETSDEKNVYTPFHRLVFNIKKLIPGGSIGSYASALYLIKDHFSVPESKIEKALLEIGLHPIDFLYESSEWFMLDNQQLSPGTYKLKNDKIINGIFEELAFKNDKIYIQEECYPVGDIFGISVYKAIHVKTNKEIYITPSEIVK